MQRYLCLTCKLTFSAQSFRVNYRLRKPELDGPIFDAFVSKVTHRQTARILRTRRSTVERRLRRFGIQCREFHRVRFARGLIDGVFQLDEAETFETDRLRKPVTVPVLIERDSRFFVHIETAPLPARVSRGSDAKASPRKSGSRAAVKRCFERLNAHLVEHARPRVQTDCKPTYPSILNDVFGKGRCRHQRTISTLKRDTQNPLFAINHTLAMLRDGLSRLVRRTWAHAKLRERLDLHLWIYVAWRNYVRGVSNKRAMETPAMAVGIEDGRWTRDGILDWSARFPPLLTIH